MFCFHFRYWAVEVVAEDEEPIGMYEGADDDDNDQPSQSVSKAVDLSTATPGKVENDSQQTEYDSQQF